MKFQIIDNKKLQFFNDAGDITGELFVSQSGDMYIRPLSGSGDLILGNDEIVGTVEIGNQNIPATLSFLGGGTISANGNTLNIGSPSDIVNLYNTVYSQSLYVTGSVEVTGSVSANEFIGSGSGILGIISSSYAISASHLIGGGGGGGIFVQTGSFYSTTNDLQITGSLLVSGSGIEFKTSNGTVFKIGDTGSFALGEGATNTVDTNVAIGKNSITEGAYNVAVGNAADNDGGSYNIAIGSGANTANVSYGIAIGGSAYSNSKTISIGHSAIGADGTIAIGYDAGHSAGENNILIGLNAGNSTSGDGNIIIGSGSLGGNFDNQLRIGSGNSIVTISGSLATGDIHFYNTASAPNFSGSFQGDGSNLTGVPAGTTVVANPGSSGAGALSTITIGAQNFSVGGGSIFTASNGYQQTINNLIISESNASSSLSVINSGSTIFDVQGSVGQLFEVQDGLDGVLMSVNDISGIPILTVSSSGDVILAQGSNLLGTASVALNVPGVSAAFPFTGSGAISGSLNINGSGSSIFDVDGTVGSLFSVNDGLDGIVMSVNDISGLPLFEVSSSGDVEIVTGNISGSALSTASFGHFIGNGSQLTNLPASSPFPFTGDAVITGSLIQNGFLEVSGSTRLSGSLDVLTNITASGNISSSGNIVSSNISGTNTGDQDLSSYALITAISGSFTAPSASFATRVSANEVVTAKTLVSSSTQFTTITAPFTGSFTGSFQGDGSQLTGLSAASGKYGIANSSGEYTYYTDLSSSLQGATSGDTIQLFTSVTESANHSYHLKDGVDFNFNGNELFYETTTTSGLEIFTDNGAQVSCSFYNGRVRFNQPNTGTNKLIYLTGTGTEINNLGFEWEVMDGTSNPIHLQATSGVVNGGKFIAGPSVTGYFIRQYFTFLKNVEIITYNASALFTYFAPIKNSQIYGYLLNATNTTLIFQNVNGLDMENCYVYLEGPTSGTRNKITNGGRNFNNNTFMAKEATGIVCASSLGNDIFVDDGDYALTVSAEVVGGNIDITGGQGLITGNEATSGVRVTGLNIRVKDYLGPAAQVGTNTSLMGCNFFEDYGQADTDMIQVKTGCTGVEVANCTFDFFNVAGRIANYGITAVDNGTVVKFANNTIMGGTLFEASKVTQGILNTPDAQGNMSMTF